MCQSGAGTGTLHVPGSDSGLVTRAAFKAVWPQANTCGGGFDSHPLPPLDPAAAGGFEMLASLVLATGIVLSPAQPGPAATAADAPSARTRVVLLGTGTP